MVVPDHTTLPCTSVIVTCCYDTQFEIQMEPWRSVPWSLRTPACISPRITSAKTGRWSEALCNALEISSLTSMFVGALMLLFRRSRPSLRNIVIVQVTTTELSTSRKTSSHRHISSRHGGRYRQDGIDWNCDNKP